MRFCELCGAAFQSLRTCPRDRVPTRSQMADPILDAVFGERYRILERIASGGMGQVYRAAHTRIACLFAVKVLYGDIAFEPSMMTRFLREAEVASCLQSRYIVRVIDFGQSAAGLPYLVMEYLNGSTLYERIIRSGAVPPMNAARIAARIARGLVHAHERGIIHRDLKSENVVLVREDDEDDVPKLLDFGVARLRESERLTGSGVVVGTPLYMAPEQFKDGDYDARVDLYSLGVILFEMIRGTPPFEATSSRELAAKHLNEPPPDLEALIVERGGRRELGSVVRRLLAKSPDDRYGSARELVDALESVTRASDVILADTSGDSPLSIARRDTVQPLRPVIDAELIGLIESAIVAGAPAYNRGDYAGCAAFYKRTVEEALRRFSRPLACAARLRAGLLRASTRETPVLASWEVRYAFDDLLLAAPVPSGPDDDPIANIERELAIFGNIAAHREQAGHTAIIGDFAVEFARSLVTLVRAAPGGGPEAETLERAISAAESAEPGVARLAAIRRVLDPLPERLDGARERLDSGSLESTASAAPLSKPRSFTPSPPLPPPPARATRSSDEAGEGLHRGAQLAAEAYAEGRFEVAYRVLREAIEETARVAGRDPAGAPFAHWLASALTSAAKCGTEKEAAVVLRGAIEAIMRRDE
ncbi:MAG: serine/threonine-protein kinase [Polyangiaceae bacterium]